MGNRHNTLWGLSLLLVVSSIGLISSCCSASMMDNYKDFTAEYETTRVCMHLTPEEAYQRALQGWRTGFGRSVGPLPTVVKAGDAQTGVGLVIEQPLVGLQESIVEHKTDPVLAMVYTVLNPQWYTCPVEKYIGQISFEPQGDGTLVRWHGKWTPLSMMGWFVQPVVSTLMNQFIDYIVLETKEESTSLPQTSPQEKDMKEKPSPEGNNEL